LGIPVDDVLEVCGGPRVINFAYGIQGRVEILNYRDRFGIEGQGISGIGNMNVAPEFKYFMADFLFEAGDERGGSDHDGHAECDGSDGHPNDDGRKSFFA
jgi:hypothetical protein